MNQYKYFAFISYSHKDRRKARLLQQELERYNVPSSLRKENPGLPKRIRPVFRDISDLSLGVLTEGIDTALRESKFLIVLCSEASSKSIWVDQEIRHFFKIGEETGDDRQRRIIPVIVGQPSRRDSVHQLPGDDTQGPDYRDCLPESLKSLSPGEEILAANYYESGRRHAFIKIIARMLELNPDTLWERSKRRRKKVFANVCAVLLVLCALAYYSYQTLSHRIEDLHSQMVIDRANALIESEDPITAQRLLLTVIPEGNSARCPAYLRKALYYLRKAEYEYQNGNRRVIPGTFSHDGWYVLNDREIGNVEGTVDIYDGRFTPFPDEIHYGPDYCDHVFSEDGRFLFVATLNGIVKYEILSHSLSEFLTFDDLAGIVFNSWKKYFTSISMLGGQRLGVTFTVGEGEETNGLEDACMACIIDTEDGKPIKKFYYPILSDDKDRSYSFVDIHVEEDEGRVYFLDNEGKILVYDIDDEHLLGVTRIRPEFGEKNRVHTQGTVIPGSRYQAAFDSGHGVVVTPLSGAESDAFLKKHSYAQRGDSLVVSDSDGNRLTAAYCPYRISAGCFEIPTETIDPQGKRTLISSPGGASDASSGVYLFDWQNKRISKIGLDGYNGERFYWSREGDVLIVIDIDRQYPVYGGIRLVPLTSAGSFTLTDHYGFSTLFGWPISGDYSLVYVHGGLYSADSGEYLRPFDSGDGYLLCSDDLVVRISEDGLHGFDVRSGETRFSFPEINKWWYEIDQISPNHNYLGLSDGEGERYIIVSLTDGHMFELDTEEAQHLLTDDCCFSFHHPHLSAWTIDTGKKIFDTELPVAAQKVVSEEGGCSMSVIPDQSLFKLASKSSVCIFDAENGSLIDVISREYHDLLFSSSQSGFDSHGFLSRIRERYRFNALSKDELKHLLSD